MTVRVPHLSHDALDTLSDAHRPHLGFRDPMGCWFQLEPLTRAHPDVVLVKDGEEDDLYVVRGTKREPESVYRWPEIYDALRHEDRHSVQAAVWGMYVHEPKLRMKAARERAAKK